LTGALQGRLVSVVMDRVILDSQGVLWIVDYKTGHHEGAGREEFLLREQERYRDQMVRYAAIAKLWRGNTPVRTALYFPLMSAWCELH
jgi:ATP-dependent exoDNAse (exonuclease V) beta subunit